MQYSDSANKQGIIEDIDFLVGTDSTQYSTANKTRNVNERQRMVWTAIFESYGGWRFMDDNSSDTTTGIPYADINIVSGTGLYGLPTGALTVSEVSILTSATARQKLNGITPEEWSRMQGDASYTATSTPLMFMLQGDVIRIVPIPNYSLTAALRVYFDADFATFTASDTTRVPGFASPFHRMLSVGAALDYALTNGMQTKVVDLQNLWNDYERRLRVFYNRRYLARFPHRIDPGTDLMSEFA
jgi:hypothetical protein